MADTFDKRRVSVETTWKMVAAAKADSLGMVMVIAVVDESGLLKAFRRMDDALLVGVGLAQRFDDT